MEELVPEWGLRRDEGSCMIPETR